MEWKNNGKLAFSNFSMWFSCPLQSHRLRCGNQRRRSEPRLILHRKQCLRESLQNAQRKREIRGASQGQNLQNAWIVKTRKTLHFWINSNSNTLPRYNSQDIDASSGVFTCLTPKCTTDDTHAHCLDCGYTIFSWPNKTHGNSKVKNDQIRKYIADEAGAGKKSTKAYMRAFNLHREVHEEIEKCGFTLDKPDMARNYLTATCNECDRGGICDSEVCKSWKYGITPNFTVKCGLWP